MDKKLSRAGMDKICRIAIAGREWLIHEPFNLDELWNSISNEDINEDERLPYWVEVWPASVALVEWLWTVRSEIRGRLCMDLGCGLGLSAIAGQYFGARMIGSDYEVEALAAAGLNAGLNYVDSPCWLAMDWRKPAIARYSMDRIWASDIIYEKRFVIPLVNFFVWALKPNGKIWLSDPGRNIFPIFCERLQAEGLLVELMNTYDVRQDNGGCVKAHIWEVRNA